jgi:hypothetical protein
MPSVRRRTSRYYDKKENTPLIHHLFLFDSGRVRRLLPRSAAQLELVLGRLFPWGCTWSALAARTAVQRGLIGPTSYYTTTVGGLAGVECRLAALFEIRSLTWPLIPMLILAAWPLAGWLA